MNKLIMKILNNQTGENTLERDLINKILDNQTRANTLERNLIYMILRHYLPIPIILISMVCIIITILVALKKGLWRPTSQYLITLALVDLMTMPLLLYLTLDLSKSDAEGFKVSFMLGEMLETLLLASNWITTLVAAERFFAITYPLKMYRIRRKHRRMLVVGVLLFSFALKLPSMLMHSNNGSINPLILHFNTWIVLVLFYMFLPFGILVVVNIKLIQELLRMSRYFRTKFDDKCETKCDGNVGIEPGKINSLSACFRRILPFKYFMIDRPIKSRCIDPTFVNSRHRKKSIREERRIITTLVVLIFTFFILQAPWVMVSVAVNVGYNLNYGCEPGNSTFTLYFKTFAIPALSIKSVFYFVFYCWFCNKFMKTMQNLFHCGMTCSRGDPDSGQLMSKKDNGPRMLRKHFHINNHDKNNKMQRLRRNHHHHHHHRSCLDNNDGNEVNNDDTNREGHQRLLYIYERSDQLPRTDIIDHSTQSRICYLRPIINQHNHYRLPARGLCVHLYKARRDSGEANCPRCNLFTEQIRDSTTTEGTCDEIGIQTPIGYNYYSNHAFSSFYVSGIDRLTGISNLQQTTTDDSRQDLLLDQFTINNNDINNARGLSRYSVRFLSTSDSNIGYSYHNQQEQ